MGHANVAPAMPQVLLLVFDQMKDIQERHASLVQHSRGNKNRFAVGFLVQDFVKRVQL